MESTTSRRSWPSSAGGASPGPPRPSPVPAGDQPASPAPRAELGAPLFERIGGGGSSPRPGAPFCPTPRPCWPPCATGSRRWRRCAAPTGAPSPSRRRHPREHLAVRAPAALPRGLSRIDLRCGPRSARGERVGPRGDAAFGLRYEADPHPDLVSALVHEEPLIPVCSAHHRFARPRRVAPGAGRAVDRLPARPGVAPSPTPPPSSGARRLGPGGAEIVPIDSLTAQKRMVEAGFGLALLPESSVNEELRAGRSARCGFPP